LINKLFTDKLGAPSLEVGRDCPLDSATPSPSAYHAHASGSPHETLCSAVKKCDCAAMYMHGTSEYVDCLDAKRDLIVYACSSAWVFKGNGTPILAFPGDSQPSPPVLGLPAKRKDGK
jgi:hypothetical protein